MDTNRWTLSDHRPPLEVSFRLCKVKDDCTKIGGPKTEGGPAKSKAVNTRLPSPGGKSEGAQCCSHRNTKIYIIKGSRQGRGRVGGVV